jgi:HEAT repeat protein
MSKDDINNKKSKINPSMEDILQLLNNLRPVYIKDRISAIEKLKEINPDYLIDVLRDMINSHDSDMKILAAEAMTLVDFSSTLKFIIPLLNDSDSEVRWSVCYWLSEQGNETVIEPLIETLKKDNDATVRSQAAIALGASHDLRAKEALEWTLKNDHEKDFHGHSVSSVAKIALSNFE